MIGRVVSTKMKSSATITILVEWMAKHPLYKKTFIRSKKYLVNDPVGVKDGDVVEVIKIKPISKNKHWQVVKVVGQNLAEIVEAEQKQAAEEIIAEIMPEKKEEESRVLPAGRQGKSQESSKKAEEPEKKKEEKKGEKS